MSQSFFVAGGTLDAAAPSYVVRNSDEELYRALRGGEYCYVLTPRQTGKSSLMVRTVTRLRSDGVTAAALDLTASGQNLSPEQWYTGLLDSLARQCGRTEQLEDYWEAHRAWGPAQRWINAIIDVLLPHASEGMVLFIDEIDFVRSLPFPTDEFFAAIRECHNRRATDPQLKRLTFCLLGVATPADLIRDPRATPFNVGRRIDLADFTEAEALSLSAGIEAVLTAFVNPERARRGAAQVLRRALFWTRGHPYLTQRLCFELVGEGQRLESGHLTCRKVDELCQRLFFSPAAQRQDINTLSVRDRLLLEEAPGGRAALLDLYGRVLSGARVADDETNRLVGLLRLSGAVVAVDHRLQVRNRIYARLFDRAWVRRHMPDAELQRQRRAVRLAVARASAVASIVVAALVGLASMALTNEAKAKSLARSQEIVIGERNGALADHREALKKAQSEEQKANTQRTLATQAAAAKEVQRQLAAKRAVEATRARTEAVSQGRKAAESDRQSQVRLARLHVADGWRLAEQGDHFGALLHFQEALRLETGNPVRERLHRLRLASILAASPRVKQVWRYSSPLAFAGYSPDGKQIVVVGEDRAARIGSLDGVWTSPLLGKATSGENPSGSAEFGGDGKSVRIAIDGKERLWSSTGKETSIRLPVSEQCETYSSDWSRLLRAVGSNLYLHDVRGERLVAATQFGSPISNRPRFSQDGKLAATVHQDGAVRVWRIPDLTPACYPLRHSGTILCADFSKEGDRLVTGSEDRSARVWDVRTGRPMSSALPHQTSVMDVQFSPDGTRVATAAVDGTARVWDAKSGRALTPPLASALQVSTVRFSPDGACLATASADGTARVWDAATGRVLGAVLTHGGPVRSAQFFPDGSRVLTASAEGLAREWELATADPVRPAGIPPRGALQSPPLLLGGAAPVSRSPNQSIDRPALVIENRGTACYVRLPDGRQGPFLRGNRVISGDLSVDGLRLITAHADGAARQWESLTCRPLTPPMRHGQAVHLARFSPDGRRLVTSSLDGTTRVWDPATGRPVTPTMFQSETVRIAALNRDATLLATATDTTLRLWDAMSGEALSPPLRRQKAPAELAFLVDSVWLKENDGVWKSWQLAPLTWTSPRLNLLIAFLAGRTLDGAGGTTPYPSNELLEAWRNLRADYSRMWQVKGPDLLTWHEAQAGERERGGQWAAAAFHLGRVIQSRPEARELRLRRGIALAESGVWVEAAGEFAAADPKGPFDTVADQHLIGYRRALCQLAAGDQAGHRKTCDALLERYRRSKSDRALDIATWTSALGAEGPSKEALSSSRELVQRNPGHLGMAQTLGALQVRAGQFPAGRETLLEVVRRRGDGGEALDHLFLALACRGLNLQAEARRHLDLAEQELVRSAVDEERIAWGTRLELRLLHQEAAASIRVKGGL